MKEIQVAIVTGAAGGIGEAIVRRLGRNGVAVVGTGRNEEKLKALKAALGETMRFSPLVADMRDDDAPKSIVSNALETFGRIDYLINNAGAGVWAPVHQTTDAMLDEVLGTSLRGPFRLCREVLPHLKKGAAIVNIGSVFGVLGGLDGGIYCAAKAGLIGLTQTMAAQYGAQGIRSNLVAPGVIRTPMTDAAWDAPAFRRINQELTPHDREGTVEDVANVVAFLCSTEGEYINGQTLNLDGGWTTTKYVCPEALTR